MQFTFSSFGKKEILIYKFKARKVLTQKKNFLIYCKNITLSIYLFNLATFQKYRRIEIILRSKGTISPLWKRKSPIRSPIQTSIEQKYIIYLTIPPRNLCNFAGRTIESGRGILSLLDYEETILSRPNECSTAQDIRSGLR